VLETCDLPITSERTRATTANADSSMVENRRVASDSAISCVIGFTSKTKASVSISAILRCISPGAEECDDIVPAIQSLPQISATYDVRKIDRQIIPDEKEFSFFLTEVTFSSQIGR